MKSVRLGIVVSEFNYDVTYMMLQKALQHAKFLGATVTYVVKVPGSYDLPLGAKNLLVKDDVDAVVALGAVIQGATKHDEIIAQHCSRKLVDLSLQHNKPVTLGVSGPGMNRVQALERAEEYAKRSVEAAVKLVGRMRRLGEAKYVEEKVTVE
jgi:6,7-dimethyl-8-ribityllumazine synthase